MYLQIAFWIFVCACLYPYLVYPAIVWLLVRPQSQKQCYQFSARPVSLVLCAHNEQDRIAARIQELSLLAESSHRESEVIVVSDGSTDLTAKKVVGLGLANVRLLEVPSNRGKAHALSVGVGAAKYDIIVFADVRQTWDRFALIHLLAPFNDPAVGAVSGELVLRHDDDSLATVGAYWRMEKWLRWKEGRWRSCIGVTGAISATRRGLFSGIPEGLILDDVYWPMMVARRGKRVVHEPQAKAYDRLPATFEDEYRRKLRTLTGNFQLLGFMPSLLLPWGNPLWFQFISHKVLRLAVPWLFLAACVLAVYLSRNPLYAIIAVMQLSGMITGAIGWLTPVGQRFALTRAAGSVFGLNFAAWMAFWMWISGRTSKVWHKARYSPAGARSMTEVGI
jgi:cellulose synthase/poly-beta-1,6-N-acetylglucosamine synthase-like glycosyltransferase